MKTVESMMYEAQSNWDMWQEIANDPQALADRDKTKKEAVILANYFEGVFDGLCDARDAFNKQEDSK